MLRNLGLMNLYYYQRDSNRIPTGKCGKCGGVVSAPRVWAATTRIPECCESCGATVDEAAGLPVKKML